MSDIPLGAECEHGHLLRKCETCQLEAELAEVKAELAAAKRGLCGTGDDYGLGQLRHLYAQLMAGGIKDQRAAAEGLLAPGIEYAERVTAENARLRGALEKIRTRWNSPHRAQDSCTIIGGCACCIALAAVSKTETAG